MHLQLNLNDSSFCVVNQTVSEARNLKVRASYFDLHGKRVIQEEFSTEVAPNTFKLAGKIDHLEKPSGLWFLRLNLLNEKGEKLDENLYWLVHSPDDMKDLEKLKEAQLEVDIEKDNGKKIKAIIKNSSDETAFFTRLKAIDKKSGQLVLPLFFTDNYLTLFPGESKEIEVDFSLLNLNQNIELVLEPYNGKAIKKTVL